jgi:hypothetical protein
MNNYNFTFKWTNWTFGIWWDNKVYAEWGFDLGPIRCRYEKEFFKLKPNSTYKVDGTISYGNHDLSREE